MTHPPTVSIAIASDLHCHAETPARPKDSFLIAGARRVPSGKHPVQSLVELIRRQQVTADVLVCPGDLANKVCSSGMMQAWEHLKELERELKARQLLLTIGNHDVDSRKETGPDPFDIPRNLHPDFPVASSTDKDSFWSRGFYFSYDESTQTEFLILNTVIGHSDEATARRGTFNATHISRLQEALESRPPRPIQQKIAVLHHHPVLHSSIDYGSTDVLEFGDQILNLLAAHRFQFILHGHRHDPRITRTSSAGSEQIIFAAGAFSAYLKELSSITRNLFHILQLSNTSGQIFGKLQTWEFNYGSGWRCATTQSATIPHFSGFSIPRQDLGFLEQVYTQCDQALGHQLREEEIQGNFPQFTRLLPEELNAAKSTSLERGYKLVVGPLGTVERIGKIFTALI